MKVRHVPCGPVVSESERKAFDQLKKRLASELADDEWLLLTHLTLSATHRLRSDQIDIVAVGPPGVRVIEVKHWTADWVNRNRACVEQEADRVAHKARKVEATLRRLDPSLGQVNAAFLITETDSKAEVLEAVRDVPFYTFKTWRGAVGLDSPSALSLQQIEKLGGSLASKKSADRNGELQRLAGYTRLKIQTPADERFHRIYKATHASRQDSVLLHLYDLSASDGPKAEKRAKREWQSLHRLQQHSWVPRIVDSFQWVPGYDGEVRFFTVSDPVAPSVYQRATDDSWGTRARLDFTINAMQALGEIHATGTDSEPMIHGNLTPNTILVRHDNLLVLAGLEHVRISLGSSLVFDAPARDCAAEVSPEVRSQGHGAADRRSDIYSLCASMKTLFENRGDEASRKILRELSYGMSDDPEARSSLSDLQDSLSELSGDSVLSEEPNAEPPSRFWTEEQLVLFGRHRYRIVSCLGSGGVGATFKVVKVDPQTQGDLGTYVAKVVRDKKEGHRVLRAYELAHSHLRHSALSMIFEVAAEWHDNQFVALMTWIEGSPLSDYMGALPMLAEEFQESAEELATRWLQTACEALRVLHDNGLVHGDVSPGNLIVSGGDLVLTDYDCVGRIGQPIATPGTALYCSPSHLQNLDAGPSDDLYALAASFFRVLFEKAPFQYDGVQAKERGLNWDGEEYDKYQLLAAFLDRATDPVPEKRFTTATDALGALRRADSQTEDAELLKRGAVTAAESLLQAHANDRTERRENEVEWLKSLLQSYPGSQWGNSETRGLDTEFSENTYIATDLEDNLYRNIIERRVRLVVLCGNAGDGKTALLQRLFWRLDLGTHTSDRRILRGNRSDGLTVCMNLDGSASWRKRSADDLLDEFLAPFQGGQPKEDIVHLLAINDGRLLEWIETVTKDQDETPLTRDLSKFLEGQDPHPGYHIQFVNLNQRSLVGSVATGKESIDTSFLDQLVDKLYGGQHATETWKPCQTCSAQERCNVFQAMRIFGPDALADKAKRFRARQRLFEALQAVHLRSETHITVRELRATLIYILFGVHYCSDYHASDDSAGSPTRQSYAERAFSPRSFGRQGDVLRELVRLDPALDAHPQIDRILLHPPSIDDRSILPRYGGLPLEEARRRAYFEWTEAEAKRLTEGDPHALDLVQGRHLRRFRALSTDGDSNDELTKRLCAGISRLETLPPKALDRPDDVVPLKITPRTPTETAFWIEKSVRDFCLETDDSTKVGCLHRNAFLIYRYRDGNRTEKLRLGAELFHLLLELSDGYQLGDVATDDTFAHLSIFVQRLVQEDHRHMFSWSPMREDKIFKVSACTVRKRELMRIAPLEPTGDFHAE